MKRDSEDAEILAGKNSEAGSSGGRPRDRRIPE
jgi:hypothetical protein